MADGAYGVDFALIIVCLYFLSSLEQLGIKKDSNNGWRCAKQHTCPIHYFVNT